MTQQFLLHVPAHAASAHTMQLRKLAGSDTDGAFTLIECHSATHEWVTFPEHVGQYVAYVVEGAFLVRHREETVQVQKGDILHAPTLNAYQLVGENPGSLLVLLAATAPTCHFQHIRASQGQALAVLGDIGIVKVPNAATSNQFLLMEWRVFPQRGVMMHAQASQETFYILGGRFALQSLRQNQQEPYSLIAEQGDVVHVPKGVPHAYRNVGEQVGTMLVLFTPPGQTQQFFEAIGTPVDDLANPPRPSLPDPAAFQTLLQKYRVVLYP